jgi:hypothetical protein
MAHVTFDEVLSDETSTSEISAPSGGDDIQATNLMPPPLRKKRLSSPHH